MPRRTKAEIERAKKKALAARKHWLKTRHHMTLEEYDIIKEYQGGICPGCRRSNGRTKALAVEHDHKIARESCDHPDKESCLNCWRGLMCGPCNDILGWLHDDVNAFYRFIDYLRNPPAQSLRRAIQGEPLMPCITCGARRCPLGVPTCEGCDAA